MDSDTRAIARRRVQGLFELASGAFRENPAMAQRYVAIARRIAMAAKIRLPPEYRLRVCRHCKSLILPGANCRVRIKQQREPHVTMTCLSCGKQMRMPLRRRKEKLTP